MNCALHTAHLKALLTACIIACGLSLGMRSAVASPGTDGEQAFKLADDQRFANVSEVLKRYAKKHRPAKVNDFCVLGYLSKENSATAWIVWEQGKKILIWDGGEPDFEFINNVIDLRHGVVKSEADLHGSTYLVTRKWVRDIKADCKKDGVPLHFSEKDLR